MKRSILILLALAFTATAAVAQRTLNETYDVKSFTELDLDFEYPQLVRIKVWDKYEVKIEGTVDINAGEYDEDFELRTSNTPSRFKISSNIKNMGRWKGNVVYHHNDDDDDDDKVTMVSSRNGTTVYTGKKGRKSYRNRVYMDIEITVTIPRDMDVMVDARYGLVEVLECPRELEVEARYGGVDVTVDENTLQELDARTQWGQIYTDLKVPVDVGGNDMIGQWMKAHVALKKGNMRMKVESQYGNVYLRKN